MASSIRLCILGLPKTGKTTYLAALWAYLRSPFPDGRYSVPELPPDTSYLDAIASAWAGGETMPRSSPEVSDHVEFAIQTLDEALIRVNLPDLPGEVFLNAIRRPIIDELPARAVLDADLLLLFVNCRTATMFEPLGDHPPDTATDDEPAPRDNDGSTETGGAPGEQFTVDSDASSEAEAATITEASDATAPVSTLREFKIGSLDSDTLNSELLVRMAALLGDAPLPPLLIVVTAWDVFSSQPDLSPDDWLRLHQPMLWQSLRERRRRGSVGVMGISAQGADYGDHPEVLAVPIAERAWGCNVDGSRTDIVGPLVWFSMLEGADG